MTLRTRLPREHTDVIVWIVMTTFACRPQSGKLTGGMALLASQAHMGACQREVAQVMVKGGVLPIGRIVAGSAIRAKLTVMLVILLMAGVAIRG